jgi:hypothetical protein
MLGIHFTNHQWTAPPDDYYRLLALCRPRMVKTCLFNQCGYDQIAVHRRLRAEHPDALIVARLMGNGFDSGDYWRYIDAGIADAYEIGNEPNHPAEWSKALDEWLDWFDSVLAQYREWFPKAKFVFPGMAVRYDIPGNSPQEWYFACRDAVNACDYAGVHCYWQHDNQTSEQWGELYIYMRRLTPRPIIVTEVGDSTPGRSATEKARLYVQWARKAGNEIVGSAVYILGGTDDWREFELDEAACRILGTREETTMSKFALRRPLPDGIGRVTQWFGANPAMYTAYGLAGHEGIDYGAPIGTSILACHAGTVRVLSGTKYGTYVRLDGDGFETVYAHLNGVDVEDGQHVEAGQKIGRVGSTGNSTGPHLHLGLRIDRVKNPAYGNYVDPMIGRILNGDA